MVDDPEARGAASSVLQMFSDRKVIDSGRLNRWGAQPARAVLARGAYHARRTPSIAHSRELQREGFVVIEDFLAPDEFERVRADADRFVDSHLPTWLHSEGTTVTRQFHLANVPADRYPALDAWVRDERVLSLAESGERRPLRRDGVTGGPLIEDIEVGDGSEPDPQTRLHVDTYFSTHKVWLYLTDVTLEDGPLVFVPRSHYMDALRLGAEYRHSNGDWFCDQDSRRVPPDELTRRGLAPVLVTCPRNTLVIANTCGYHRRAVGQPGRGRRALHFTFRDNPFSFPMPRARATLGRAVRRLRP